ncbi:olfactory receptor 1009-like isoform X1 [Sceloporus undulatus]|uniref:olfactory receptor 1009-like isoform X1 n=1 Tax=Sceloporus undulatus TaxID=8520 RepID=UPI001C4D4D45|nr:olfactory receptor 1009-like isoform X1 [Sceloporus undulatus]
MTEKNNTTPINEFLFVGLTNNPLLQIILFLVFLTFYFTTLVGNLGMIALIMVSPRLHTPMYFFLSNLSLLDVCFSSVVASKSLVNLLAERKSISFIGCAMQMYFVIGLGSTECFLLAAMAYDRYVAICKPLLYPVLVSPRLCIFLVVGSYVLGLLHSLLHTVFTFRLSFCQSNEINHLYCDITALLSLSCTDIYINELLIFYVAGFVEAITLLSVLVSYVYILANIVRIGSAAGRLKAFSTCTSHLTAVTIFHGAILILHFRPKASSGSSVQDVGDKILSVFYTIVIPLLNPLIYSLRNKEVKDALGGFQRKVYNKIMS